MYKVDIKFQYHMDVSVKARKGSGEYLSKHVRDPVNICAAIVVK